MLLAKITETWNRQRLYSERKTIVAIFICCLLLVVFGFMGQLVAAWVGGLSLILALCLIWWLAPAQDQPFLVVLFCAAFAARLVTALATFYVSLATGQGGIIFPDESGYDTVAWAMAQQWKGVGEPVNNTMGIYTTLAAVVYFVSGHNALILKVINAALGAGIAPLIWYLAHLIFPDTRVGKIAGALTAFFPSLVLWTSLNLRDAFALFILVGALIGVYRFLSRVDVLDLLLFVVPWALLRDVRFWVFIPLGWLIPFAAAVHPNGTKRRWLRFASISLTAVLVPYLAGFGLWGLSPTNLPSVNEERRAMAVGANTICIPPWQSEITPPPLPRGVGPFDAKTLATIAHIPGGLICALGTPFPWVLANGWLRAAAPEMVVWYILVIVAVYGAFATRKWREWFMLAGYVGIMLLIMAVIEGNTGTTARHRDVIVAPFIFIFSAQGLSRLYSFAKHERAE